MSIRSIPLMALVLVLYNVIIVFASEGGATELLQKEVFALPIISGARLSISLGDMILFVALIVLFAEVLKATYTSTASLVDHGLSMLVFVICLVEFLVVQRAGTSVFAGITGAALFDVIAGYTIGIRVARRDIGLGGIDN